MTEPIRVFIDDHPVSVSPGTTSLAAVARFNPSLVERIQSGSAYLTDGRGIRMDPLSPVFAGAILRVVVSARPPDSSRPSVPPFLRPSDEADAHA
ncbi:MAG TPA: hypothetical protein VGQ69_13280 [Gemmatimonadales bacterium]|jgi:hypothetical protein|nr:hypothetical protein [Gemmatimonadales bacterium]